MNLYFVFHKIQLAKLFGTGQVLAVFNASNLIRTNLILVLSSLKIQSLDFKVSNCKLMLTGLPHLVDYFLLNNKRFVLTKDSK
jgi:hypothetical protein